MCYWLAMRLDVRPGLEFVCLVMPEFSIVSQLERLFEEMLFMVRSESFVGGALGLHVLYGRSQARLDGF